MPAHLALVLHAHLPFVRHPEHERFLEESWLHEAVIECYLPLLRLLREWDRDRVPGRLALTLSPTLCAMLGDPLLRSRIEGRLDRLRALARSECLRTKWEPAFRDLSVFYRDRLDAARAEWDLCEGDLVGAFRHWQDCGRIEILACSATHAVLPLLGVGSAALRAQVQLGCAEYRRCFGRPPTGIWLPECAYDPGMDAVLAEAGLRWFVLDTHGLRQASPPARLGVFAPVVTPHGVAAFARDPASSRQVWSRKEGYPGDFHYRDFYRDIGWDLDLDYVEPGLPCPDVRGFTGLKYHRITGDTEHKAIYDRGQALERVQAHANHFLAERQQQMTRLKEMLPAECDPVVVCPYDAELFGHWWFEGPEFLDAVFRGAAGLTGLALGTPGDALQQAGPVQVVEPAASSWGEEGYWSLWLNERNAWIQRHLRINQERMAELVGRHPKARGWERRALNQAARELLLAQASDWSFLIETGTAIDYAKQRVTQHLLNFISLHEQLTATQVDQTWLAELEQRNNLFPNIDYRWWA